MHTREDLEKYLFKLFKLRRLPVTYMDNAPRLGGRPVLGVFDEELQTIQLGPVDFHVKHDTTLLATLLHELGHVLFYRMSGDEEKIVERYATIIERLINENNKLGKD